jgi:hypothetical protein
LNNIINSIINKKENNEIKSNEIYENILSFKKDFFDLISINNDYIEKGFLIHLKKKKK